MEVLVAMGITVLVGALLVTILVNNTGLFYKQSAKVTQGVGSNDALGEFRSSLKEAQAVAANYPESGTPTYTSGPATLVLKLATVNSSGNIVPSVFDYVVFYQSSDKLKMRVLPDVQSQRVALDQILAGSIQSVLFEYFDSAGALVSPAVADKVKISLVQRQKAGEKYETLTATSEANLRND